MSLYENNSKENSFSELINYYPVFYRDMYEMVELLKAQGELIFNSQEGIDRIINNSFILTADDYAITKIEKFLGIEVDKSKTIEARRKFVLSEILGIGKLSATQLKQLFSVYTNEEIKIDFDRKDNLANYILSIAFDAKDISNEYMGDIKKTLERRLPAHLSTEIKAKSTVDGNIYVSVGVAEFVSDVIEVDMMNNARNVKKYISDFDNCDKLDNIQYNF